MGLPSTVDTTSSRIRGRKSAPRAGARAACAAALACPSAPADARRLERGASPKASPGRIPAAAIHRRTGRSAEPRMARAIMTRKPAGMTRERIQEGMIPTIADGSNPTREKERLARVRIVRNRTSISEVTALTHSFVLAPNASYPKLSARWRPSREVMAPPAKAIQRTSCRM